MLTVSMLAWGQEDEQVRQGGNATDKESLAPSWASWKNIFYHYLSSKEHCKSALLDVPMVDKTR